MTVGLGLDRLLQGQGDVSELTWEELRQLSFREPGPFGEYCRIPTLMEVLELHRRHGGLLHLGVKRPGPDRAIADLLDRMDMWDYVAYCNSENSGRILKDPRLNLLRYKGPGLYEDRSEVFADAIASALSKPGDGLIVDDPRGVIVALGRKIGRVSKDPVAPRSAPAKSSQPEQPSEQELLRILGDAEDWSQVANAKEEQIASGKRIRARAWAADMLSVRHAASPEVFAALEERVRRVGGAGSPRWRSGFAIAACTKTGSITAWMAHWRCERLSCCTDPMPRRRRVLCCGAMIRAWTRSSIRAGTIRDPGRTSV
jgi:hypothetical protein